MPKERLGHGHSQDDGLGGMIDGDVVDERIELLVREGRPGVDVGRKESMHSIGRLVCCAKAHVLGW
jgi:hypothetical protein